MSSQPTTHEAEPASRTGEAPRPESLSALFGGRGGAVDATVPPLAFVAAWLAADQSVTVAAGVAVAAATAIAGWRLYQRRRPRAALVGLLLVAVAAVIVLYTGRAADFFLIQIAANTASALTWLVSITLRWPLLGLVVGGVLGQRTRWRRDPALVRAYARGSGVWVLQYLIRVAVLVPLWLTEQVVALGVAGAVLSWPLVAACMALSWPVVQRALPVDHPGLRHPVID